GIGCCSERQKAQRQRIFHWPMPVRVLSRMSWSFAWADRRICLRLMADLRESHAKAQRRQAAKKRTGGRGSRHLLECFCLCPFASLRLCVRFFIRSRN